MKALRSVGSDGVILPKSITDAVLPGEKKNPARGLNPPSERGKKEIVEGKAGKFHWFLGGS